MSESTSRSARADKKLAPQGSSQPEHEEHGHHNENEYPYVAHHFDSPTQQLEAGKLGIWLFLVTEILFFAGLFCAYTIYRARYPEVFYWAHFFLDTKWGAINTIVLILSSLTAAWAVRNAQLGQQKLLIINILITIGCACTFMGVKYIEYSHKAHAGLLPGEHFQPHEKLWESESFKQKHPESAAAMERLLADLENHRAKLKAAEEAQKAAATTASAEGAAAAGTAAEGTAAEGTAVAEGAVADGTAADGEDAAETKPATESGVDESGVAAAAADTTDEAASEDVAGAGAPIDPATIGEQPVAVDAAAASDRAPDAVSAGDSAASLTPAVKLPVSEEVFLASAIRKLNEAELKPLLDAGIVKKHPEDGPQLERPTRARLFFSVYFFMTGLHGLHVLIGIGVWVWLLLRALKGQFGPLYFGPIDFAALYWHLVDLIWIYLFPLLYLIH